MKHKIWGLSAFFICCWLIIVARHHPPSRRKIKEIWHGRVFWEKESNTTMLRSSPETVLEQVEPKEVNEISTNLGSIGSPPKIPPEESEKAPSPGVKPMIAICAATHSKSNWRSLGDTTLQNTLIPSIEKTISTSDRSKYDFRLYLAADHDDHFWLNNHNNIRTPDWLSVHVGFYNVPEHKIPFNPMMRAAYNDGAEYMVRINDDSEFMTSDWVSKAVAKLASYDPPNVGMIGPNCREGNAKIMTHDMVHRTHLDIFEHYYPDVFSAWWIDDWISKVYGPQRSTKMMDWTVKHHTHKHGTRYKVQGHEKQLLKGELEKGAVKIEKWLKTVELINKEQTVVIIGKGESAKPVQKTPDNIIVTINHALGFQPYSDIHFHLDWYFEDVPPDFFCRTKALVVPTYFHVCSSSCRFVHASLWLSKLKFDGPIFLVQLPDGPKDNDIEMWSGKRIVQSSGDLSFAWMLARGYRKFESYGIGGDGYANYYISKRYKQRFKLSWSTSASRIGHTQKRINEYGATWNKYLEPTTSMETPTKIDLGPCIHESGWDTLKDFGPSIMEAQKLGAGDDGVSVDIISKGTAVIPKLKRVSILLEENDSFDKGDIIVSVNTRLKTLKRAHIHFQLEIPKDNMDMNIADILVVPTYINDGNKYVPIEDILKKIKFRGPIFKIQLNNGPQNVLFESIKGDNYRDISHNWMLARGYRLFNKQRPRSCIWNNDVNTDCYSVFRENDVTTSASKILFLGDSTVFRLFMSDSSLKCPCKSIKSSGRCDLIESLSLKRAPKWISPVENEGPVHYGLNHPFCTDCSGCSMKICIGPRRSTNCIEQNYIPIEFAKDVEMQTTKSFTSQEMIAEYLSAQPALDVCIVSTGMHDMAISNMTDDSYVDNVKWYLTLLHPHCIKIIFIGQNAVKNDPKYPQWNSRIHKWDIMLASMIRKLDFVVYVSIFDVSKNVLHLDNTHLHPTFYMKLKKMLVGYLKPRKYEQDNFDKTNESQKQTEKNNEEFVFPMRGDPFYQKTLSTLDTNFDCIRRQKINHMCEFFRQSNRKKRFHLENVDWKSHWSSKKSKNAYAFNEKYNTCVVLGSSSFPAIYDYSKYYEESDAVFVINGLRPWMNISSNANLFETFDFDHYKQTSLTEHDHLQKLSKTKKELHGHYRIFKPKNMSRLILTSWSNLENKIPNDRRIRLALPSGQGHIKSTVSLLGLHNIGYTSGIFNILWLKSLCNKVQVIGFYGFNTYEHGKINYNPSIEPNKVYSEKGGQLQAMDILLRLNELKQIEFIL